MEKFRIIIRRILIVVLVLWMIGVFGLSAQNATESSSLSTTVANIIAGNDAVKARNIEPVVRKVAHMTEYAVGAMIFYGILLTYNNIETKKRIILTLIYILFYASTDEVHQLFIEGRSGSYIDVLIDFGGGIIGVISIYIIESVIRTIDNKVKLNIEN